MKQKIDYPARWAKRFAEGKYISPRQLEDRLKDPSFEKPMLIHDEYMWLKQNHPEFTAAYEKHWSPMKEKIWIAASITFWSAAGYGIYELCKYFLEK
jgi:hypothetical protein